MALTALAITLDSPGPVLFRQIRVGLNRRQRNRGARDGNGTERRLIDLGGEPFVFYKFRTMYADARERFPELYQYQYTENQVADLYFKRTSDPRLTRLGARLRRTTLDELPNFINVLKRDMNLIGPRPDIPEMVKYYTDRQRRKFAVRPGITGLSQVSGRGLLSFQETLRLDVLYVDNRSLWLDLKLLLRTFAITVLRAGAF
jgi:lipopolysaccharide/colanic/teichoic acid biosynthesis glycosyltransferase